MDYSISKKIYGFSNSPVITNVRNITSSMPSRDFINPGICFKQEQIQIQLERASIFNYWASSFNFWARL